MAQEHKTALITGASAGIGRELAKVFAQHGFHLVLVSRNQEKLQNLAREVEQAHPVGVTILSKDLTAPGAPQAVFDAVEAQGIAVEVLVNNAGITLFEPFKSTEVEKILDLVRLNVVSLTALTRLFLDPMLQRRRGRILNVASIAGYIPTPSFAVYGASKAFVLSLSEALSEELRGTGVTVTALCPGFTDTDMVRTATRAAGMEGILPAAVLMDAETVAREGYAACMAGRAVHVNGLGNRVAVEWMRLQPRWLVRSVAGLWARFAMREE